MAKQRVSDAGMHAIERRAEALAAFLRTGRADRDLSSVLVLRRCAMILDRHAGFASRDRPVVDLDAQVESVSFESAQISRKPRLRCDLDDGSDA